MPRGQSAFGAVAPSGIAAASGSPNGPSRMFATPLRAALSNAVGEELLARNAASIVRLPTPRKRRNKWWSADEARAFLESARRDDDPFYAAYVLILVLGLRRGEALGLTWDDVNFDAAEIAVTWQLQRAGGQLHHRETKTPGSTATLPLPPICLAALKLRAEKQEQDRVVAGEIWCSPRGSARPSSPVTSTGSSRPGAANQEPAISGSTTPAGHVLRCWWRWTFTRAWRCRYSGTAGSR